jgi:NACHT domain
MAIQYYFDNLDPTTFQRLINVLLTARYGESVRLLPLRGADGGRDAETAPTPTLFEVIAEKPQFLTSGSPLKPGRYLFQVKHHRTTDRPGSEVRSAVVSDFEKELSSNVLNRADPVNYFFLITNVPSSKDSISRVDEKRMQLLSQRTDIQADVLWQDHVFSWLDQSPQVWSTFAELFPGNVVPLLGQVAGPAPQGLPRSVRIAVETQSKRDGIIRFRQINLEQRLSKLFVDLDVYGPELNRAAIRDVVLRAGQTQYYWSPDHGVSCIGVLASELAGPRRIILEGGPGQGKSTVSQMLAQLYRSRLLNTEAEYRHIWESIPQARFPFRLELRAFAEWLGTTDSSVEQFLAAIFSKDAGGGVITVENLHTIVENQPVILILDGLDEVGSDDLRDLVISKILDCLNRFETSLKADLRVVLTTRPPAIAGRISKLAGFVRAQILPLSDEKVDNFVRRWTEVQCDDSDERQQVSNSFKKRKSEQHVRALVKNPMQLSVLLHFIRLKGEAFPDRRAELYREYFKTVIDRDVEKSPRLRQHRDDIEALHEVIGFEIHSRAESDTAAASLDHEDLIQIVRDWLAGQGRKTELADELFRLGEERLGLIMVLRGEGLNARYGFDVQPIREYFTAAFINDKCEGNAHDLFQFMVRRSFWREVALFLAGLRRANERADLLSRARTLDDSIADGWRGEGRAIVLQLLQEGVLTTPGHVHRDAISFLIEALDPLERAAINDPTELLRALPDLLISCDSPQLRQALRTLLDKALNGEDRYVLSRLWKVAHRVIPVEDLQEAVMRYASTKEGMEPLVKLLWPAQAGLDFVEALQQERALSGPPQRAWAQYWFQAAFAQPSLTRLEATPNYHEFLIEQFAFQPLFMDRYAEGRNFLRPARPYAIWRLCENIQLLALWLASRKEDLSLSTGEVDFSGLSESTRAYLAPLIESSSTAVERLNRRETTSRSLDDFLTLLDNMLMFDGLAAWVASRCAVTLMHFTEGVQVFMTEEGRRYYSSPRPSKLSHMKAWRSLRRNLTPLFRAAIPYDVNSAGKTLAARIIQQDLYRSCPSHVRIAGKLESVPAIIVNKWLQGSSPDGDWIDRTFFPMYWIPELVRTDPALRSLAVLASRPLDWCGPWVRLDVPEMKELFSIVRQSGDPAVAAGALFAAIGSTSWNVARVKTLGKMLEADAMFSDIGSRLFNSPLRNRQPVRIKQLAEGVIRNKFKTSLSTSKAAARFLAENSPAKLPPLRFLTTFPGMATKVKKATDRGYFTQA